MSETKASVSQPPFESAIEQLQGIVKKLESGELSLEDSLRQFEDGVKLTRICQEYLSSAEQRVEQLIKISAEGQPVTQSFSAQRSSQGSPQGFPQGS